jgi:5-methylcytosine-specific restriction protein A
MPGGFVMPYKPKHPCGQQGCSALTHERFCPAHAQQEARRYEQHQRNPATAVRYGKAWWRICVAYLATHPLCESCLTAGKCVPAALVHHRVPLADGGTHAEANLCALCDSCHSAHHARDGSRWGKAVER